LPHPVTLTAARQSRNLTGFPDPTSGARLAEVTLALVPSWVHRARSNRPQTGLPQMVGTRIGEKRV